LTFWGAVKYSNTAKFSEPMSKPEGAMIAGDSQPATENKKTDDSYKMHS
jgi:hypothetical protein